MLSRSVGVSSSLVLECPGCLYELEALRRKNSSFRYWKNHPMKEERTFLVPQNTTLSSRQSHRFWFNLTNHFFTHNSPVIQCLVSQEDSLPSGKLFKQRLDENFSVVVLFTSGTGHFFVIGEGVYHVNYRLLGCIPCFSQLWQPKTCPDIVRYPLRGK